MTPESYLQSIIKSLEDEDLQTSNGDVIQVEPNGDYRIGKFRYDVSNGKRLFTGKERVSFRNGPMVDGFYDHGDQRGPLTYFYPSGQIWFRNNDTEPSQSILLYENKNVLFDYDPKQTTQHGAMLMPDGTIYRGDSRDGTPDGIGSLFRPDQTLFYGKFTDGRLTEYLAIPLNDGTYAGAVRNGLAVGVGTRTWNDGAKYVGGFDGEGMFSGSGELSMPDGRKWSGQFSRNIIVQGTLTMPDGNFYRGGFANGEVPRGVTWFSPNGVAINNQPPAPSSNASNSPPARQESHGGDWDHTRVTREIDFDKGRDTITHTDRDGKSTTSVDHFSGGGMSINLGGGKKQ